MRTKEKETSLHRVSKEDEEQIYSLIDHKLGVAVQYCHQRGSGVLIALH